MGIRRERAGRYRSDDDRFSIEQTGTGWWVADSARSDELGQPLLLGPYASMKEARDAMAAEPSVLKPKKATRPKKRF
jgi:hypothetical protein